MSVARLIIGDARRAIQALPDRSVDLVVTSPPYLGQRRYLPTGDPNAALELGQEQCPGDYLDALLEVLEQAAPKLAPHGSVAIELGDTYSGSSSPTGRGVASQRGRRSDSAHTRTERRGGKESGALVAARPGTRGRRDGWPAEKSLAGVPALLQLALTYGRNPLTGRKTVVWRVRNVVPRCSINPSPGADSDKFRPAVTYVIVACQSEHRYFDDVAVRRRPAATTLERARRARHQHYAGHLRERRVTDGAHVAGAPMLDWQHPDYLVLPGQPFAGAHFATMPEAAVAPFVSSMCPLRVCRVCGDASRRIVAPSAEHAEHLDSLLGRELDAIGDWPRQLVGTHRDVAYVTVGWTACAHAEDGLWRAGWREVFEHAVASMNRARHGRGRSEAERRQDRAESLAAYAELSRYYLGNREGAHRGEVWRAGAVLDPFCGTGTTLRVATRLGRDAIGIDLDRRNARFVAERVGLHLSDVVDLSQGRSA